MCQLEMAWPKAVELYVEKDFGSLFTYGILASHTGLHATTNERQRLKGHKGTATGLFADGALAGRPGLHAERHRTILARGQ